MPRKLSPKRKRKRRLKRAKRRLSKHEILLRERKLGVVV